jgi:hypothetical protein
MGNNFIERTQILVDALFELNLSVGLGLLIPSCGKAQKFADDFAFVLGRDSPSKASNAGVRNPRL